MMERVKAQIAWLILVASGVMFASGLGRGAAIVNNAGTSSEDSVVVSVINWDSSGLAPVTADSFWVMVVKSDANEVVFKDSGTTGMAGLDTITLAGSTIYYYHRLADDIDGDGSPGLYAGAFIAKNTGLDLFSCSHFAFQVVGWELDDLGDSAAMAAVLYDSLVAEAEIVDSLYAILDSLQNHDEWVSSFDPSTQAVLLQETELAEIADTLYGRDSLLYPEGYWHKIASRADSGSTGASLDSASIAAWVWNTPQINHTSDGTFGKYLDAEISGIGSGSGLYSFSLVTCDSTIEQVIPGARVVIRNLNQTSVLAVGGSDADGLVNFNLDAGSYLAIASASGYLFKSQDTVIVSGTLTDTVFGDQFDPGAPSSPNLCRVYGHLYGLRGEPEEGATVTAGLPSGVVRYQNTIISPTIVSTTVDDSGYFYLDLIPSALLQPDNTTYEFCIMRTDGTILRQRLTVPDTADWQLTW